MENSLKLQLDVKNNAEDLQRYLLDLQCWEEEMKQKEGGLKKQASKVADMPPPRNKIKRNLDGQGDAKKLPDIEKKPKKIHAYDYSAWDKYDVDKACAEVDKEPDENPETSQSNIPKDEVKEEEKGKEMEKVEINKTELKNLDEAFYEKELGNQFVRKENWEEAIKCYTRAIKLDSKNAIYYANRALCFIKLKKSAEVDSTVAIQLDNTYVKAYQRRAFARVALGQIQEALSDYREVVKLEPNNAHTNAEIVKIEKKLKAGVSDVKESKSEKKIFDPKIIFKNEIKKNVPVIKTNQAGMKEKKVEDIKEEQAKEVEVKIEKESVDSKNVEEKKGKEEKVEKSFEVKEKDSVFDKIPDGFTIVKPVHVPPHLRSKKPLRRVPVKDILSDSETFDEFVRMGNALPSLDKPTKGEIKEPEKRAVKTAGDDTPDVNQIKNFPKPETFLQFQQAWKIVKNDPRHAFSYLQKTTPKTLFKILKHNLESDLFSELISILSICADTNRELAYDILSELTSVDRFGSLIMFLSPSDKKNVAECIDSLKSTRSDREIQDLRQFYLFGNAV